jgi:DNA polymerase III subunit epsilon
MDKLDFTAFDTETATNKPASICQIGIVQVKDGQISYEKSYLIQPPENEYDARHSSIHGIDALMTKDQPPFPIIWENIRPFLENNLIVAHNAGFDLNTINSTLDYFRIPRPLFTCDCTFKISGLSLKSLSEALKINMVKHHDALSDARTCALAYISLKNGNLPDERLILHNESPDPFAGHERLTGAVLRPNLEVENINNPFHSKKVVFTGVLQNLSREEAAKQVQKMGADIDTGVNKRTDFVIVGHGAGPSKLKKIEYFNSSGSKIRIIQEDEFLTMIK